MDSFSKSKSNLYKYRRATFPKNPTSRKDIIIENKWQLTLDQSEQFLLADDGIENRILVLN